MKFLIVKSEAYIIVIITYMNARNSLRHISKAKIKKADFIKRWQEFRSDIDDIQTFLGPRASQDFVQWVDLLNTETADLVQLKCTNDICCEHKKSLG